MGHRGRWAILLAWTVMFAAPSAASATPVNTLVPSISGVAKDGQTLKAAPGIWSSEAMLKYAYAWQRCQGESCVQVPKVTHATYKVGAADVGSSLQVLVTASGAEGAASATSKATAPVSALAPASKSPPKVTGTAKVGETLSTSPGKWVGTAPLRYSYSWERCSSSGTGCARIEGATSARR